MLSGEATDINSIVLCLTRSRPEPTIDRSRGEHVNHYTTNAVVYYASFTVSTCIKKEIQQVRMISLASVSEKHRLVEEHSRYCHE